MEAAIEAGRVTVNGVRAGLGMRVRASDRVAVDEQPVRLRWEAQKPRLLIYHKPPGELVTASDPRGRPTVFERLPRLRGAHWIAVGRLDFNTGGLLLFTDSGDLADRLMHPRNRIEREYAVRLRGQLSPDQLDRLARGVMLYDGLARFDRVEVAGGTGSNRWYRVVLREGRNREIRRVFEKLGIAVSRLMRVRFGTLWLPSSLRRGQWREMHDQEVAALTASIGEGSPAKPSRASGRKASE